MTIKAPSLILNQEKNDVIALRKYIIQRSRELFWEFCVTLGREFYTQERLHLRYLCRVLQALYEGRIIRRDASEPWQIVDGQPLDGGFEVCRRLIINIPPQHGKTRTLINFCKWVLGKNVTERIITCSYNDGTASDFSRYTRDEIEEVKNLPQQIVYSDIFPQTKLKPGNASFEKWALDGQHFNYIGAGIEGSITGKGGTILIVDDPVKDATTAYNEAALNKIWLWYTSTFISRVSAEEGEPLEIVMMTRWSKHDICGKLLSGPEAASWYTVKMEAYNETKDRMLCPSLLSKKRYLSVQTNMDSAIFRANYHQEPVDIMGKLYGELKEYNELPHDLDTGKCLIERVISYTDTADEGNDFLCSIAAGVYKKEIWILEPYYTSAAMEVTEPEQAAFLVRNQVRKAKIESNNGGRGFARNVERLLWANHQTRIPSIEWFHQTDNKMARILTNSSYVTQHVFFPQGWRYKWPQFYTALTTFQKEGKNSHDDAPDCLTGLVEMVTMGGSSRIRSLG